MIGSSRCLLLLWLVVVIALVLVFRQSFENRSIPPFNLLTLFFFVSSITFLYFRLISSRNWTTLSLEKGPFSKPENLTVQLNLVTRTLSLKAMPKMDAYAFKKMKEKCDRDNFKWKHRTNLTGNSQSVLFYNGSKFRNVYSFREFTTFRDLAGIWVWCKTVLILSTNKYLLFMAYESLIL